MNTLAYFWAENARQSFTRAEILLYLYLNQNADSAGSLCRSTAELAAALHLCSGTILRARKSLKERGIITLTKSGTKTTYSLIPPAALPAGQNIVNRVEAQPLHGSDATPDTQGIGAKPAERSTPLLSPAWQARISRNMHISPERLAAAVDDYLATVPPIDDPDAARTQFLRWLRHRRNKKPRITGFH